MSQGQGFQSDDHGHVVSTPALLVGVPGTYYFSDQEGSSYSLGVNRTSVSHTVR